MDSDYHWLITTALVTSSVIAFVANAFLLLIFTRRRSLRTIPNRFVINLLMTNLLSSLLLIPLLVVDQRSLQLDLEANQTFETNVVISETIHDNQPIKIQINLNETYSSTAVPKKILCHFAQASTTLVCTASIFSILLIGINQYFGVIHSLRYHFYVNKFRASIFILVSWLAALLCATLSALTYSDGNLWHFCQKPSTETYTFQVLTTCYAVSFFFCVILLPFLAICIIYVCIYTAARQNSERMRKSTSACSTTPLDAMDTECPQQLLPKVHSAPNLSALEEVLSDTKVKRTNSDRNNFIVNLKHKISNASVFRYREETRAAKISVLVIFMVLICYVPYGLNMMLTSALININLGQIFNYLSLVLLVFSNVLSPFLFGYRNKRVKREIGRMLGLVPPCGLPEVSCKKTITRNRSVDDCLNIATEPLIQTRPIPEVIVTCKVETEKKSILKRVGSGWSSYKKCHFITVPDSCLGDARGSFSSASTQVSNDEF